MKKFFFYLNAILHSFGFHVIQKSEYIALK